MLRANRANPYNGFRDDRERRLALVSRDVRYVLIAIAAGVFGMGSPAHEFLAWLSKVVH